MRGRWIKIIPTTLSAPGADKEVMKDQVFDVEILEDEVDLPAMKDAEKDQRGDIKYPYKVLIGVSRKSCCVCCRLEQCH